MHYVYVLKSINYPKEIYIGFSNNIKRRIKDHNNGNSKHTSKFAPWRLELLICFLNEQKAINFEKYLKTSSGMAFRNKRLI